MRNNIVIVMGCILFLSIVGCNLLDFESVVTPAPTLGIPISAATYTPQLSPTPTPIVNAGFSIQQLMADRILRTFWSPDSRSLLFQTPDRYWEFEVATNQIKELGDEDILKLIALPDMALSLPDSVSQLSVSPSGQKFSYLNSIEPTKTPSPDMGVQHLRGELSELWVNQNDSNVKISELHNCFTYTQWADSEERIILHPDIHENCIGGKGLYVNLEKNDVQLIFPDEIYPNYILIQDFSFDGNRILWSEKIDNQWQIGMLNMEDNEAVIYDVPQIILDGFLSVKWTGSDDLLFSYFEDGDQTISIYQLQSKEIIPITSYKTVVADNALGGVFGISLSPDRQWAAFQTGRSINNIDKLWIVNIN